LCRQIVDLIGLVLLDEADEVHRVRQVAVMHREAGLGLMRVDVEVVDAGSVEGRGPPLDAVDRVALLEK
jgi:hypothetical protein